MERLSSADVYAQLRQRTGEGSPQPRLTATRAALRELGDPHLDVPFIHVTGTNGKTSTSRIAESILRASGRITGLFTSPHLVDFAERIAVDGSPIDDMSLASAWTRVTAALTRTDQSLDIAGEPPLTFFEALTALAFTCFSASGVDCAVIEVGMGGEWDSTNVADGNVAVITPISLDHAAQLGSTVAAIAHTKSGIIKRGAQVVSSPQEPSALSEILRTVRARHANIRIAQTDFTVQSSPASSGQLISISGLRHDYGPMHLPMHGKYQAVNAAVAVAAVEAFLPGPELTRAAVTRGLLTARSPGRLERIGEGPDVYVDVAHNPAGAEALARASADLSGQPNLGVVLAVLDDKDAAGIVKALSRITNRFFVTRSNSERSLAAEELGFIVQAIDESAEVTVCANSEAAIGSARAWALEEERRALLVTGSATLVGDILSLAGVRCVLGEEFL